MTHADLFLENPVKLPFLNIELPLLAFFFLAPILFMFMHAYTLVHLVMLTEKAKRFHQALNAQRQYLGADRRTRGPRSCSGNCQATSSSSISSGRGDCREASSASRCGAIAWITLAVAPVLLLLMMQVQFLPFHSLFITWTQRIALVVDLMLLGWLWRTVLSGRELGGRLFGPARAWPVLGAALT